jgi:hypothetical protein
MREVKTAGAILILLSAAGAAFFHFVLERAAYAKDANGYYPEMYGYVSYFRMPVYLMMAAFALLGLTGFCLGLQRGAEKSKGD